MFKTILQTDSRRAKAAVAVGCISPLLSFLTENKVKVTGSLINAQLDPGEPPPPHSSPTIQHHWNTTQALPYISLLPECVGKAPPLPWK